MKLNTDQIEQKNTACRKVRKGDRVLVISGNSRGMSGNVMSCNGHKVIVEGINIRKRHMKGQGDRKGSIVSIERPIHISNVRVCTADNTPLKLKTRIQDGQKELYYMDGNNPVQYRSLKKS